MRIGIISDIHGNFVALKQVLNKLDELGIDEVYSLGDVAGYYTQINECCNELRSRGIPNLMGNHDWYLSGGGFCPRSESVNDLLDYQRSVITKDNLQWLQKSTVHRTVGKLKMVHAGWTDPIDEYIRNPSSEYFNRLQGKYFVSGHTHIPIILNTGNKLYCNPGSVGQPRDGDSRASFAIFDNGTFRIIRVTYEIKKVCDLLEREGFGKRYYDRLFRGL